MTQEVTQQGEDEDMSQEEADAATQAAAEEKLTLEEFRRIDTTTAYGEQLVIGLGNCQLEKYAAENGEAALEEF